MFWPAAAGVGMALAFVAGDQVGKSGHGNEVSVPAAVTAGRPDPGIVQQGDARCDLSPNGFASDDGCTVAQGKGFRAGYHTVRDGWAVRAGKQGPVLTLTVGNGNPGSIGGFWHTFELERFDGSLVEIVWCDTPAFAAGESRTITCEPLTPKGNAPFDAISIHY
jgi:hypothetical protein